MAQWNLEAPTSEYFDHNSPCLDALVREICATTEIAIDTETTGLISWKDLPLYWSLAWGNRRITLNASTLQHFKPAFSDPTKRWIFANAKYDAHILANAGIAIAGHLVDIQVMHSLLYDEQSHALKDIALHLLHWKWHSFQDTFGKIGKLQSAEELIRKAEKENFPLLVEYAANDAWGTLCCYKVLKNQLMDSPTYSLFPDSYPFIETLDDLFENVEMDYTKVLWKNERNGILVDQQYLNHIEPIASKEIEDLEKAINKEAGTVLNPSSPTQIQRFFFDVLKVKPFKFTKGGAKGVKTPSVDKGFLEHYAPEIPIAKYLLEHRNLSKLYSTYIVGIGDLLDPNGRLHTRFNQDVTRTGRLSCVAAWTKVETPIGGVPISELKIGYYVRTHKGRWRRVLNTVTKGISPMYAVRFSNGNTLTCTTAHKLLSAELNWISVGEIINEYFKEVAQQQAESNICGSVVQIKGASNHSPHRRESIEQQTRQPISPNQRRTQSCSLFTGERLPGCTVEEVVYSGSFEVYDITVEEDESYETCGIFSHNSSNPNTQNIPKSKKDKWKLRGAFIAEPGNDLIVGDFDQLEMRLLACAAQDADMIQAICNGLEIHSNTTSLMLGVPYELVEHAKYIKEEVAAGRLEKEALTQELVHALEERDVAKTLGFAQIYGQGPKALAAMLGLSLDDTIEKIEKFNQVLPAVARFTADAVKETEKTGYAFTILGRRRNLPEIMSNNFKDYSSARRKAVNTPIQGSAADVIKMAQLILDKIGIDKILGCRSLLQVHDELVHECPKEHSDEAILEIKDAMQGAFANSLPVPLTVSIHKGRNWLEAK